MVTSLKQLQPWPPEAIRSLLLAADALDNAENSAALWRMKKRRRLTPSTLHVINTKNCSLSIVLTATDQKPQKSLKR